MEHHNGLAILVGGGPAPGINSVVGAATIRARLEGLDVIGVRDGFEWIMRGDIDHVMPLSIDATEASIVAAAVILGQSRGLDGAGHSPARAMAAVPTVSANWLSYRPA